VRFEPMKPTSKPPGTKRLKVKYDTVLSTFAFNFKLRRYIEAERISVDHVARDTSAVAGRGLHSFQFQPNLSSFVHYTAQHNSSICPGVAQVEL